VPSRLEEPATGFATVVFLASSDAEQNRRSLGALESVLPRGADVVVVADRVAPPDGAAAHEVVRTSASLGRGAALNVGVRRARASIVVVLDPSIVPLGDIVTPLVEQLRDSTVAIAGPFGLMSPDLRRFEEVMLAAAPVDVTAVGGQLMAFRRADAAARGPVDEGFRFYQGLDVWWSLVLRDEGEGQAPRRAVALPALELQRAEPAAWGKTPAKERDRLSRRNAYRILDSFRDRLDLAHPSSP